MADSLFDVLLFDSLGNFQDYVGLNLPFTGAIALSRGVNDTRKRLQPTAVVLPAGEYDRQCESKLQAEQREIELYCKGKSMDLDAMHDAKMDRIMAEVVGKAQEARSNASTTADEPEAKPSDDSEADAKPAGSVYEKVIAKRHKFVRREFRKQLRRIWQNTHLIEESADIGIVAASLEAVARAVDGACEEEVNHERFDYGLNGDLRYTELEQALGVVR